MLGRLFTFLPSRQGKLPSPANSPLGKTGSPQPSAGEAECHPPPPFPWPQTVPFHLGGDQLTTGPSVLTAQRTRNSQTLVGLLEAGASHPAWHSVISRDHSSSSCSGNVALLLCGSFLWAPGSSSFLMLIFATRLLGFLFQGE